MIDDIKKILLEGNNKYQWKVIQEKEEIRNNKKPKYPVLFLTCMDSRIDVHRIFQLEEGDVFVFRNAGNVYTEDVLRSILIAIYEYNIKYIIILGHLDCGMAKINLFKLRNKLSKPALIKIYRNGTNVELSLQKFFKIFIDEIKNVNNQVERIKSANEIPSWVQVIGMLYDPRSGWVFDSNDFQKYPFIENFMKDYKKIIENKKMNLIDYFESIEEEIIGKPINISKEELLKSEQEDLSPDDVNESVPKLERKKDEIIENEELTIIKKKDLIKEYQIALKSIRKIKIPKIYIPKIKVITPKIYRIENK